MFTIHSIFQHLPHDTAGRRTCTQSYRAVPSLRPLPSSLSSLLFHRYTPSNPSGTSGVININKHAR